MTDQSPRLEPPPESNQELDNPVKSLQDPANPSKIQILVTNQQKKEIIDIESSSEKAKSIEEGEQKAVNSYVPKDMNKSKVKRIQHKCQLCKGTGKKVEMKKCSLCKLYSHLHCLQESEGKGKYICDKCKSGDISRDNKILKKSKKQEQKLEVAKASQKKIQKEKKKDESNKTFLKFRQKYPYYIGDGNKIKYPIQDKLLLIYRDYFEISETRVIPIDHPLIPSEYIGDLIEVQNFIVSFGGEFQQDYNGEYRKSALYSLMNCVGSDRTFERLMGAIIKIYLKDIYEKNKTENVKILNDNSFFILLGTMSEYKEMCSDYIVIAAAQIIRNLSNVPSMKNSFKDFVFPEGLDLGSKLRVLVGLIEGLSQVDSFHDLVSKKSQKISQMTKDKADYVTKLKNNQAEALSNKQKLKEMLGKGGKGQEEKGLLGQKKVQKEVEKNKKKSQKLVNDNETSQKVIKDYKSRIIKIARQIPFVISQVLFLGKDRNGSEYFFYLREPHRLYVKYHGYLLDTSQGFKIYESKEKIMELLKSLNTKGINQRKLFEAISHLVKEEIIRNLGEDDVYREDDNVREPMEECVFMEHDYQLRQKLISVVMQIEEKFTDYLLLKSYRWASDVKREQFRFGFPYIEDVKALKEQIKSLQQSFLFVEVVRDKQAVRGQDSESNDDMDRQQNMNVQKQLSRRKKPIRIWGINSQRIKKFWVEYLESCTDYIGIWISVVIFKNYVDKYLDKKMEHIRQQERKENIQRQRELREKKIRQEKEREQEERNLDRLRSRDKPKLILRKNRNVVRVEHENEQNDEGIKTRRSNMRSTRANSRPLTIDSDNDLQEEEQQQQQEEESGDDDECDICKDIGDVICCDTCPKVFHLECLGLKETPEGEWSCMDCLYRISTQRQTRSKGRT